MSLMPNAPRSIGGVLDDAIRLYRKTLVPCLPIALLVSVLTAVPGVWLALRLQGIAATDARAVLAVYASPAVWGMFLAIMLPVCALYGALFSRIDAMARGEESSFGAALGVGLKRAPVTIGVTIVFVVMLAVGFMLLLIPGFWVWGVFQLAFVAAILERAGVFGSLGTSYRLVKGNWWRSSVISFVAIVIMYVLMLVIGIIVGIIIATTGGVTGSVSLGSLLVQQGLSSLMGLFVMSFLPSVMLSIYYDLKLRNEGADLASRVEALN